MKGYEFPRFNNLSQISNPPSQFRVQSLINNLEDWESSRTSGILDHYAISINGHRRTLISGPLLLRKVVRTSIAGAKFDFTDSEVCSQGSLYIRSRSTYLPLDLHSKKPEPSADV
ncbi:hypothetical protein L6452_06702 [Arctium lappa]|uniref:Uncharacterized protein n=1 Tax=Arctium lappa TaxID=4217 RepID=A0ACB9EJW4_ARCLA|nr:hypothetical protein L6452_06702 [Arctium lappa]